VVPDAWPIHIGDRGAERASGSRVKPDIVLGPLTVFVDRGHCLAASDGRAVDADDLHNVIVRLVVEGQGIVDAATPQVSAFRSATLDLLVHIGLPATGRTRMLLARHGLTFDAGSWVMDGGNSNDSTRAHPP
jgi:hypothetical protein